MFVIKLTPVSKNEEIWVNPNYITAMRRLHDYTVVMTINGFIGVNVKETPAEIIRMAEENRLSK